MTDRPVLYCCRNPYPDGSFIGLVEGFVGFGSGCDRDPWGAGEGGWARSWCGTGDLDPPRMKAC